MKKKISLISTIVIAVAVILIAACFAVSMNVISDYAEKDCFDKIEESTSQISDMFVHSMDMHKTQLEMFSDILTTNESNSDEVLQKYMEKFCETQTFSGVCIHRKDGTHEFYGKHLHGELAIPSFDAEVKRLPYISDVYRLGESRKESYVYIAVPIIRGGETTAVLYGYISLESFPSFISSTAYDGECEFYIVDGNTGDFLMDEYHRLDKDGQTEIPLSNVFDGSMGERETKPGYSFEDMRRNIKSGDSGYFVFKSQRTSEWYYTYYMPVGINNWSVQITVDEPIAFATYEDVRSAMMTLMICVISFALLIIAVLLFNRIRSERANKEDLRKSNFVNEVQGALISAHNNPNFVHQALKIIAKSTKAETVLLLNLDGQTIRDTYYWPSKERPAAMKLMGMNVSTTFPTIFDILSSNESMYIDEAVMEYRLSDTAKDVFAQFEVKNMLMVPIMDNAGALKAVIATVNIPQKSNRPELLQCLARDFFLAIANLESYTIIKNMGTVDYLTGVKNRNSYETELGDYDSVDAETLWCVYMDANGLHEINNTFGHKAGDLMLCTVAEAVKRIFGKETTYRIGGDEFLSFATDLSEEEIDARKQELARILESKGYFVSVGAKSGVKQPNGKFGIEGLVNEAEALMYADKKVYYQKHNITDRR